MPDGPARASLAKLIGRLSEEQGTFSFPPHVTLLGSIPRNISGALRTTRRLARGIAPFELRVDAVTTGDDYFRCVFLRVAATPALLAAHRRSRDAFSVGPPRRFFPHLSLIYADLDPPARRRLAREIRIEPFSFRVSRVHLWLTHGGVPEWRAVGSARFGEGRREKR
jgi:2'-5' RNA ligase